ncbi:MAG: acyl carrier protein, partial [Rhodocyclaceae bacterium]
LSRLLREGAVHAAVLPMDWPRFLSRLAEGVDAAFFRGLGGAPRAAAVEAAAAVQTRAAQWHALPPSQRRDAVLAHLAEQALQVLGLPATTPLDGRAALKDMGLDSLMAVELRNLLARSIGTSLPATLLFDYPTLEAMAAFLMQRLELAAPAPSAPATDDGRTAVTALSEEEAEAQLLAELAGASHRPRS